MPHRSFAGEPLNSFWIATSLASRREPLAFFYDERTEEFIPKQEVSPAPVRERGR